MNLFDIFSCGYHNLLKNWKNFKYMNVSTKNKKLSISLKLVIISWYLIFWSFSFATSEISNNKGIYELPGKLTNSVRFRILEDLNVNWTYILVPILSPKIKFCHYWWKLLKYSYRTFPMMRYFTRILNSSLTQILCHWFY